MTRSEQVRTGGVLIGTLPGHPDFQYWTLDGLVYLVDDKTCVSVGSARGFESRVKAGHLKFLPLPVQGDNSDPHCGN